MGLDKIGAFVAVAVIAALVTFFVMRPSGGDGGRCDIHPHLSDRGLAAMKANLDRARTAAYNAAIADKKDRDVANKAGEDAAADNFVYNLRDALTAEYLRHRRALDGCF
jgi:hypothetical protein